MKKKASGYLFCLPRVLFLFNFTHQPNTDDTDAFAAHPFSQMFFLHLKIPKRKNKEEKLRTYTATWTHYQKRVKEKKKKKN